MINKIIKNIKSDKDLAIFLWKLFFFQTFIYGLIYFTYDGELRGLFIIGYLISIGLTFMLPMVLIYNKNKLNNE